jgi:hypothetical protein
VGNASSRFFYLYTRRGYIYNTMNVTYERSTYLIHLLNLNYYYIQDLDWTRIGLTSVV